MKRIFFLLTLSALFVLAQANTVLADYSQYGQYGQPAPVKTILVDKFVGKVTGSATKGGVINMEYVDNLTPADARFKPGNQVSFKIKVKNTSTETLTDVTVKDYVPAYLEPMEGPGIYDPATRIITWKAGDLAANEEKVYYLTMQLFPQNKLPADKGLFCLVNKAQGYSGNVADDDAAQFCVEKEVVGVKAAPKAGPEAGILLIGAQGIVAGIGYGLKKMTENK